MIPTAGTHCPLCGRPPAYSGAVFCGAACCARWEAGWRSFTPPPRPNTDQLGLIASVVLIWSILLGCLLVTYCPARSTVPIEARLDRQHDEIEAKLNRLERRCPPTDPNCFLRRP